MTVPLLTLIAIREAQRSGGGSAMSDKSFLRFSVVMTSILCVLSLVFTAAGGGLLYAAFASGAPVWVIIFLCVLGAASIIGGIWFIVFVIRETIDDFRLVRVRTEEEE